jgi:hypothetical protein
MNMNEEKEKGEEEEAMKNNETGINRQKRRRRERRQANWGMIVTGVEFTHTLQTGFPVLIRPLNGNGPPPPLVMFSSWSTGMEGGAIQNTLLFCIYVHIPPFENCPQSGVGHHSWIIMNRQGIRGKKEEGRRHQHHHHHQQQQWKQ